MDLLWSTLADNVSYVHWYNVPSWACGGIHFPIREVRKDDKIQEVSVQALERGVAGQRALRSWDRVAVHGVGSLREQGPEEVLRDGENHETL